MNDLLSMSNAIDGGHHLDVTTFPANLLKRGNS